MSQEVIFTAYGLILVGALRLILAFYEDLPKRPKYRTNRKRR